MSITSSAVNILEMMNGVQILFILFYHLMLLIFVNTYVDINKKKGKY